jgi:Holliday junction resolvase RusA-like endonuclease
MTTIRITVYGTPAPQGSKHGRPIYRGRGDNRVFTGKVAQVESSKARVNDWRSDVKTATEQAIAVHAGDWAPLDGPLMARIVFTLRKPTSAPKTRTTYPDRKPDVDKLLRSTLDGLTSAGLIADDARIVDVHRLAKVYPGEDPDALDRPGALIVIGQVTA